MMMFAPESIPLRARGWPAMILWTAALLALFQAVALCLWYWPGSLPDTDTSGVWIALADDAARGDFYRPLTGELGTGGTRYMPLFFTLHAALIKAGLPAVGAGVALTLTSAAAFIAAVYALLRALETPRFIALPAALLMTGTVTFQMMLLTVRGDFLAAALNFGGVALALHAHKSGGNARWFAAAACFAGAFLAKLTMIYGLAAVLVWLAWRREWRSILRLFGVSAFLIGIALMAAACASGGRMPTVFLAVASGDTSLGFALGAPGRLMMEMLRDPLFCVLLAGGLVAGAAGLRSAPHRVLVLALAGLTLLVTGVIFASPGTGKNHLLDVGAVAALLLGLAFNGQSTSPVRAGITAGILGIGIVVQWLPGVPSVRSFFERHRKPEIAAVTEFCARSGPRVHPMLAENPALPIVSGERPFVADAFNLKLLMRGDTRLQEAFLTRVREGRFGSVVLSNWPVLFDRDVDSADDPLLANAWERLRQNDRIAPGFYDALQARYRLVQVRRPYLYLLRNDLPFAPAP